MSRQSNAYPLPRELYHGINPEKLIDYLLQEWWHPNCEIIPEHQVGYTEQHIVAVRHIPTGSFLRYSKGPKQGFFWDIYGEDFHSKELALIALANAPCPLGALKE